MEEDFEYLWSERAMEWGLKVCFLMLFPTGFMGSGLGILTLKWGDPLGSRQS